MSLRTALLTAVAALSLSASPAGAYGVAGGLHGGGFGGGFHGGGFHAGGLGGRPGFAGRFAPGFHARLGYGGGIIGRGGLYRRSLVPPPLATPGFRRSVLAGAGVGGVLGYGYGLGVPGGYAGDPALYGGEVEPDAGLPLFASPGVAPGCVPPQPPSAPGLPTVYYPAGTVFCGADAVP